MIGSDGGFYAARLERSVANRIYADRDAITASVLVPRGRAMLGLDPQSLMI